METLANNWNVNEMQQFLSTKVYGSGHETVAVLLPDFAINW